ncbi:MAG: lipoyl(octanoyl) transferase LipB [candidate division WOR-3 bacterium]|nr:lipoyl(octanoyl) transferase LipB [candidate division WOR-3 bacterium]MDW8114356.1 lipoyl(octanoyl) transferase LipB [candidate division WOR-3 bacterium]
MEIIDLGIRNFFETYQLQKFYLEKRRNNEIEDLLILVEHPPVITIGRNGKIENLLIGQEKLKELNIEFYQIERGGDITIHNLGQLVGYLIFYLKNGFWNMKSFINKVEDLIIQVLKSFNIKGEKKEKFIGVFVEDRKICSIGMAINKNITFHGFALNVNNDLSYFQLINPCGIKDLKMTSIKEELKKDVSIEDVKKELIEVFKNGF